MRTFNRWRAWRTACGGCCASASKWTQTLWTKLARKRARGDFRIERGLCTPCGKEMPKETFLFTLKYPMRFSVSSHGSRRTFHLLDVRYPQVYRTQPLGATRKLSGH